MEYWKAVGTGKARKVIHASGTKWNYFIHITHNRKRPSVDLARRLIASSKEITPGYEMTLEELLVPLEQIKGRVKND